MKDGDVFKEKCREAERQGFDAVYAPDHLGEVAPFPALVAAAAATERLRVGTLVLNSAFWNPHLLAREVATTDLLTGGRLEVGIGAGYSKWEFDEASIGFEPFGKRVDRLTETLTVMEKLFGGEGYEARRPLRENMGLPDIAPVQRQGFGGYGPPLLVGGTGDRMMRLAAEHADIVGITGLFQVKGRPPGTLQIGTAADADDRVRFVREHAGDRVDRIEWNILVAAVVVTGDRRAGAEQVKAQFGLDLSVDDILETPFVLIGTVDQIAENVRANRERFGFTHLTVNGLFSDSFVPVIEALR
ncbi:TIGR03621 family F420-dependent LLM class oxidoreductase [Actinomadura barringtoniae]|uniref:TIGR03621 family F420-dependent LLM class oxidoreductase n=1 Tax=Actinomadura barringtoniae TaxID=1427535 RepID=UPI001FB7FC44